MKKIYSIVLMATMLLVGTNMWASKDGAWLQGQFDAVQANGQTATITLTDNVILSDYPIYLGTANIGDPRKSIKLDLNGHYIEMTASSARWAFMFVVNHGELLICNSAAQEAEIRLLGTAKGGNANSSIFSVYGSYKSSRWNEDGNSTVGITPKNTRDEDGGYFSHLQIGTGVKILASDQTFGTGITVDAYHPALSWVKQINWTNRTDSALYRTDIIADQTGFAYGVRVEVLGDITVASGAESGIKSYCVKTNGNLKSPLKGSSISTDSYLSDFKEGNNYLTNYVADNHKADTIDVPFVHIAKSAHLATSAKVTKSTAAYSSGYAKWLVEGECKGNIGFYIKSGTIDLHDAVIESNSSTYTQPSNANGATGAGSAIVINSNGGGYDGDMEVTISGDTKVTASSGYAMEEIVTSKNGTTQVQGVAVQGGSFDGGDKVTGDIAVSTASNQNNAVQVVGASFTDPTVTVGTGSGAVTINVSNLVPQTGDYHTTEVTVADPNTGTEKTVTVISQGAQPSVDPDHTTTTWQYIKDNQGANSSYQWTEIEEAAIPTGTTVVLAELQINSGNSTDGWQQLTINNGATLQVERLLMNNYARIIVEAGGMLIITGGQGITAQSAQNIILNTSENAPATFLFAPTVNSNRHPNATVKMLAKQIGYDMILGEKDWYWHRFALPITNVTAWDKEPNRGTYVYNWNYTTKHWDALNSLTLMEPFVGYTMTANHEGLEDITYTFRGELAGGNENATLNFVRDGYHIYGNSFTGHISIAKMASQLMGDEKIDGTVWVWNAQNQSYVAVPLMSLNSYPDFDEIAPMQTFILRQSGEGTNSTDLDYASAVWGNPRYNSLTGNPAPRRRTEVADESTRMRIVVTAENGKSDFVMFTEDAQFSDGYEKGYDGAKYMNENALNMYAPVNGENYSAVATDNLEGKTLTINTVNNVNYTMSFANVNGAEYAVRDNATGAVFAIEEGASYEFAAQPNSVVEGRFEIIPVAKVPTAIDNTEAKANVKGIYTIMGQYVGEDFEVLPAGIYVVNGVKIVK